MYPRDYIRESNEKMSPEFECANLGLADKDEDHYDTNAW